jgi:hypothetical protein
MVVHVRTGTGRVFPRSDRRREFRFGQELLQRLQLGRAMRAFDQVLPFQLQLFLL